MDLDSDEQAFIKSEISSNNTIAKAPLKSTDELTSQCEIGYLPRTGQDTNDELLTDLSHRKWLIVPILVLYMGAHLLSATTFVQYIYIRIQKENHLNVSIKSTISLCYVNKSDPNHQHQVEAQREATVFFVYLALFSGIPSVASSVVLGCYSDRFGRKFLFYLPCIGALILMALTTTGIYTGFPKMCFSVGVLVNGLTGSEFTLFIACFSYVADITTPGKQRSFGIVIIESAIGLGITCFSVVSGFYIQQTGFFYPMVTSLAMEAGAIALIIFLPESFPKVKRRQPSFLTENIKVIFHLFCSVRNRGRRWMFNIILLVFLLAVFAMYGRGTVAFLYLLNSPFCWDPEKLGWYGTVRGGLNQVVSLGLIKVFQKFMSDESIAVMASLSYAVGYALEGVATTDLTIYLGAVIGAVGNLLISMLRSILSKMTSSDKQGAVFATVAAIEASCHLVASIIASAIYLETVAFYSGFVYFVFVFLNVCCAGLIWIFMRGRRRMEYETLP